MTHTHNLLSNKNRHSLVHSHASSYVPKGAFINANCCFYIFIHLDDMSKISGAKGPLYKVSALYLCSVTTLKNRC